jgi:hypothetical protein
MINGKNHQSTCKKYGIVLTIYAPMIYTAPCIMLWMHAYPLRGEVGGGWALEFSCFLGPVKWHRADRRVPFGAQKTLKNDLMKHVSKKIYNIVHCTVPLVSYCC